MSNEFPSQPDVICDFERVDAAIVTAAAEYPSLILADVAGRRGTLSRRIAPLAPTMRIAGPALTIEVQRSNHSAKFFWTGKAMCM